MNDRDLDQLLDAWIDLGPEAAPERVAAATRLEVRSTRQSSATAAWLARRFPIMNTNRFRFGIAAAAIVAAAFLGLQFLPTTNIGRPQEAPTSTPEPSVFTSERFGYTLEVPPDWTIHERAGEWTSGTAFSEQSPGLDYANKLREPEPYVLFTSQPLDLDRKRWLERYDQLNQEAFSHCTLERSETGSVDGETARISTYRCDPSDPHFGVEAVAFHDDRVYVIRVFDDNADASYDPRPELDAWIERFRFLD